MFGIDLLDQRLSYEKYPHRSMNWIQCLWHYIRGVILNNCFIVYRHLSNENGRKVSAKLFRLEIAKALMNIQDVPKFRGHLRDCCIRAKLIKNEVNKKGYCHECKVGRPYKKCSKCGLNFCNSSDSFADTCFQAHIKKQLKSNYSSDLYL